MKEWEEFLLKQEKLLGVEVTLKWLRSFKVERFDACNLYLSAANPFQISWFEEHVRPQLSSFQNKNGNLIKVHINSKQKPVSSLPIVQDTLDPLLSLSNFVIDEQNEIPFKLLSEIVALPKQNLANCNPLFIYGKEQVGKTHLLMAAASGLRAQNYHVFFVNAKTFTEHVVNAIRSSNMELLRKTYRNIDVLIIDDVQVFEQKHATQEEFFHTFNALHTSKKQIILSANSAPGQLQIEERLISRFEWGLVIPLQVPKSPTIEKILISKASNFGVTLTKEARDFLMQTFKTLPSLYKALHELLLKAHLEGITLFDENAKSYLKELILEEEKGKLTPDQIIKVVAAHFDLETEAILGKSQTKECSLPRQISMYFCRTLLKMPYTQISKLFSRDHSTVMGNVKQIQSSINSKELDSLIKTLEDQII